MGAKNHGVVMPDANKEHTLNQLTGAAFGAAGQRCMALSTAVFVGESQKWIPDLVERAKALKVNAGHIPGTDVGPVISPKSKERIHSLIQSGIDQGAKCILDGRNIVVSGFEKGNFVGPTILTDVQVNQTLKFCCRQYMNAKMPVFLKTGRRHRKDGQKRYYIM